MADSIIKPAKTLHTKTIRKSDITHVVHEQCIAINGCILDANKLNKNTATYKLPREFYIPNVSSEKQQIAIYGRIIEQLEKAGYIVEIDIDSDVATATLFIKWSKSEEDAELTRLKNKIFEHRVKSGK